MEVGLRICYLLRLLGSGLPYGERSGMPGVHLGLVSLRRKELLSPTRLGMRFVLAQVPENVSNSPPLNEVSVYSSN